VAIETVPALRRAATSARSRCALQLAGLSARADARTRTGDPFITSERRKAHVRSQRFAREGDLPCKCGAIAQRRNPSDTHR
jgi:hypothetical protein